MTLIEYYLRKYFDKNVNEDKLKEIVNYLINNGYDIDLEKTINSEQNFNNKKKLYFKGENKIAYIKISPAFDDDYAGDSIVLCENSVLLDEKNPFYGFQTMKTFDIRIDKEYITVYKAIYIKNNYKNYFQSNVYFTDGLLFGEINLPIYEDLNIDNTCLNEELKKHLLLTAMGEIADKSLEDYYAKNRDKLKEKIIK